MNILVVGGAGYIGSITTNFLIKNGHRVVVFDNLETGSDRLIHPGCTFIKGDLRELPSVEQLFSNHSFDVVIHLGSFSVNSESVSDPNKYFRNNTGGTLNLLHTMIRHDVRRVVFSSTAAIFASLDRPIRETDTIEPLSPYAKTKAVVEGILSEYDRGHQVRSVSLRYFNAAGASRDGKFGELHDPETHLIPIAIAAVTGKIDALQIFGNDYPTPDGTCVRDYIHVEDLARAHLLAVEYLMRGGKTDQFNIGTGSAISILEIIAEVEKVAGKKIKTMIQPRRPGDPPMLFADNAKAGSVLGWKPQYSLSDMISDAWNWHNAK